MGDKSLVWGLWKPLKACKSWWQSCSREKQALAEVEGYAALKSMGDIEGKVQR